MELFSIGLWELHADGTPKLDSDGARIPTYDNDDVLTFARVWTGLDTQPYRSNIEMRVISSLRNYVDPMQMKAEDHDIFPKRGLLGGYLADRRPLCSQLPPKSFLRKGATYSYRGYDMPASIDQPTNEHWLFKDNNAGFLPLAQSSPLYQLLCSPDQGDCQWPSEVQLLDSLLCNGVECQVDTVRVVQVRSGGETVYYEYQPIECVHLTFYEDAKMIKSGRNSNQLMCADPLTAAAGASCCDSATTTDTTSVGRCQYAREHVTFATANSRCNEPVFPYMNQYETPTESSPHMVSYGGNHYWHIYPQQDGCPQGCQTESNPGNPRFVSRCKSATDTFEVRCCSDVFIDAQEGDNPNQACKFFFTDCLRPSCECAHAAALLLLCRVVL